MVSSTSCPFGGVLYGSHLYRQSLPRRRIFIWPLNRDDNWSGSDRVKRLGAQTQNPNTKSESDPNPISGENPSANPKSMDPRNPIDYP